MICMVVSLKNHYVIHLKNIILKLYVYLTENIKKVTADLKRSQTITGITWAKIRYKQECKNGLNVPELATLEENF